MQEQLISFETAKLAKEKGFNIEISTIRNWWAIFNGHSDYILVDYVAIDDKTKKPFDNYISAPTQFLLQKWLRDVHKIILEINYSDCEFWQWVIITKDIHIQGTNENDDVNLTYEEALEEGLKEALTLIKIN